MEKKKTEVGDGGYFLTSNKVTNRKKAFGILRIGILTMLRNSILVMLPIQSIFLRISKRNVVAEQALNSL